MDTVRAILASLPAAEPDLPAATAVALAWTLAAGPDLAARARCLGLERGVLRLQARDASARRQIASVAEEVRNGMNRMLGNERVRQVRCTV
jgi:Dna[CI] antecedent, DciA